MIELPDVTLVSIDTTSNLDGTFVLCILVWVVLNMDNTN